MTVPYIALYPTDFLADVGHLGNTELGIYWRLLLVYYRDGRPLPADLDRLRRVAMAFSPEECSALERVLAEFFLLGSDEEGRRVWRHKRADQEIAKAIAASKRAGDKWRKIPRHIRTAVEAERHATKLNASPPWLTQEHRDQIAALYLEARTKGIQTGAPHNVDHIIPLRGESVTGLHVPWNLRVIPAHENRRKSNLYEAW